MIPSNIQTLSIFLFYLLIVGLFFQLFLWILLLFFPLLCLFLVPYLAWIWMLDEAPKKGGRPLAFLRKISMWKHISDYFPARLILQEQLDPSKTYLFGYHPHGLFGWGLWTNIMNDNNRIHEMLHGIQMRILTLDQNFLVPLWRDFCMGIGYASVSKESCDYNLSHGTSIVIVIGGAEECLDAFPGTNKLLLKKKKGFIRLALQHGANLVPIFTFGENELFDQIPNPPGSLLRKFQLWLRRRYGFVWTYCWGRCGLPFPRRHEIVTIIGSPIEVKKNPNFTENDVNDLHQKYLDALYKLYDAHADKYAPGVKLEIE